MFRVEARDADLSPLGATARDRRATQRYLAALAVIIVVSRLPQLLSPNLLLDGDECIAGLMAKHLVELKEFPTFFYGQRYSLASIEAAAGALGFALFGVGAIPLKLTELALWTAGVSFLFAALSQFVGSRRSFWITTVFVLSPAWAVWSMKARPGYITSFTSTAVLMWLLAYDDRRRSASAWSTVRWLLGGALTSLIYLAQPLWLLGVLPIAIAVLIERRRPLSAVSYFVVIAATMIFLRTTTPVDFRFGNPALIASLPVFVRQIHVNLTGAYYLTWAADVPGPATNVLSFVWYAVLLVLAGLQIYRVVTRRFHALSHLLFLSLCATLVGEWLLLNARDARYLLPMSAPLLMLAGVEFVDLIDRRIVSKNATIAVTAAFVALGSLSMFEFRAFTFLWRNPPNSWSEEKRLQQVIAYLKLKGARHVFSMNGLLESQLIFYSHEDVIARYQKSWDRYPEYVRAVDDALADGKTVAVVGYTSTSGLPGCTDAPTCTGGIEQMVPTPRAIFAVDHKYFVYVGATGDLLRRLQFQLRE